MQSSITKIQAVFAVARQVDNIYSLNDRAPAFAVGQSGDERAILIAFVVPTIGCDLYAGNAQTKSTSPIVGPVK